MKIGLIDQPVKGATPLHSVLVRWLADPQILQIDIAVAWAKRSGLQFLRDAIQAFKARGGNLNLTVGIGAGGASRQGLELALLLATRCVVFHHPSSRTFHPKLYLASGRRVAFAVVGSQNMTRGGLFENFELGVEIEFDLDDEDDIELFRQLQVIADRYANADDSSLVLTNTSLQSLLSNNRYEIGDEDYQQRKSRVKEGNPDSPPDEALFGDGSLDLLNAPPNTNKGDQDGVLRDRKPRTSRAGTTVGKVQAAASTVSRWWKRLSAADAQHPDGANTNPTGHLTLVKAGHPIAHKTWFRQVFFANESWIQVGAGKEKTSVSFDINIDGNSYGHHLLDVTHTPSFAAGQGNRTTVLHWAVEVGALLKDVNQTGKIVTIERTSVAGYVLTISASPTGSFV